MSRLYESTYVVSSYHALDGKTRKPQSADEQGFITAKAGDKIVFESLYGDHLVDLNTISFFTKDEGVKVQLNDNEKYPVYIPEKSSKQIQYMRVHSVTVQTAGALYFEGLCSE